MTSQLMAGSALAVTIVTACAVAGGALAQAQPSAAIKVVDPSDNPPADASAPPGGDWKGFATLGYHLDPHWRLEMQGGYRDQKADGGRPVDPVGGDGALSRALGMAAMCESLWAASPCAQPDGSHQVYAYSGKLIFDIAPDNRWFDPFIGVGAKFMPNANPQLQILSFGPGNTPIAYQAIAGVAFRPIGPFHIDLTYRWTGAAGFATRAIPTPGPAGRYEDQTVALGVRYLFAAPPIPPAPLASFPIQSTRLAVDAK